ncbi:hypothetical protein M404DRAFT_16699 [Pisolithus tinctorius Marx 270]|uniref:Release factor glutamine methyltransferase N-terminal domain-containing protein n=1 Tax=Pisolithus tinctorius Marx 270 TaxID=870435 RepID=A0A0C3N9W8_PISTI|nr:hypothetical protein M404DRAFT_16699 [Pisolithus tinctorius Marx 270]
MHRPLLTKLATLLGRESARLGLKRMKELQGEPLQYILDKLSQHGLRHHVQISNFPGTTPFGPLSLLTRPPTLILWPETEDWNLRPANAISPKGNRPLSVLDPCNGSGCIPLLLCHLWPPGSVRAFGLATDNALRCGILTHPGDGNLRNIFIPVLGDLRHTDIFKELGAPFDIVTANPPYAQQSEYRRLRLSVKDYEGLRASLGDWAGSPSQTHGLSFYDMIAQFLAQKDVLRDGTTVAMEVGDGQAGDVEKILHSACLRHTKIWTDPRGKQRVFVART